LSHLIPFEFSFSNFSFSFFISWLPLLHKFGELVVLEVVWFNILWVLLWLSRLFIKKRKRGSREAFSDYFISKNQIETPHLQLYQIPYIPLCNFV